jgi:phosphohistidine phosphatase
MKLYLAQHGEAAPKDIDPERNLTDNGRDEVRAIARKLEACRVSFMRVLHSGKPRAQQTAEILAENVAPESVIASHGSINPLDLPAVIAEEIDQWNQDTLVVGHLPFMAKLVTLLVAGHEEPVVVSYRPGAVVCLEKNGGDEWRVAWMLTPALAQA